MAVTIQSVRDLLDGVASKHVSDASITSNINRSARVVDNIIGTNVSSSDLVYDDAVRAMAVWLTYGTYTEGISEQLGNVSLAVQVKLDHFRQLAELFVNRISKESISFETDYKKGEPLIGLPPEVFGLTTSEGYIES